VYGVEERVNRFEKVEALLTQTGGNGLESLCWTGVAGMNGSLDEAVMESLVIEL
jgi:hypothetical protein